MDRLWQILGPFVDGGRETRKVDLKYRMDLSSKGAQAEFAKDVSAIANTPGGAGYLVIGVQDAKARSSTAPEDYVPGWNVTDRDGFERGMNQALANYCNPPPGVELGEMVHPACGRRIGVIIIPRSFDRPHEVIREGEGLRRGIYTRRGADTFTASAAELREMMGAATALMVLNFHQPFTLPQREQLERVTQSRVIEIIEPAGGPLRLDESRSFVLQARELLDAAGLTPEEWRTLPLVVNLPGFAPLAALLVAQLQGRMSRLPHVLRMRPSGADRTIFEVAEVIELQRARDEAQQWVAGV
ncbi:MAG: putative DNA binding domain-containing protein [Chloroflexi bacterium]|nr:putative DNA binding domain-containing protein [Chloroflexota bacterium]